MAKNKEEKFKEFIISKRKSVSPGMTNVPVWIMQKAGKRIYNTKSKRHWRNIDVGKEFTKVNNTMKSRGAKSGWDKKKFTKENLE